jgi:hypothetical protein
MHHAVPKKEQRAHCGWQLDSLILVMQQEFCGKTIRLSSGNRLYRSVGMARNVAINVVPASAAKGTATNQR